MDWVCADAYPGPGRRPHSSAIIQPFLGWAARHPKPIMIGEYGVPQTYGAPLRAQWLRDAEQTVVRDPQIKALVYFDSNTTRHFPGVKFWAGRRAAGRFSQYR